MKRRGALACLAGLLAACGGIPLRSVPRLMRLQQSILEMDPAAFRLAIQMDGRMAPPLDAVPTLLLGIKPAKAGTFEPIERELPMQVTHATAGTLNLAPAPAGRRWLLYSLPDASAQELARIQARFKQLRADGGGSGGGSVSVGIKQEGLAARDPAFAGTRWETWLQTSRDEGFFELWSGTVAALLKNTKSDG